MKLFPVKSSVKIFINCTIVFLIIFYFGTLKDISKLDSFVRTFSVTNVKSLKYILLWTDPSTVPFIYMSEGQKVFQNRKCPYTNCYVTANRTLLGDYTKFDVIAFSGPQIVQDTIFTPQRRSYHQKYVFSSIESPEYYPICDKKYDNFFNWTWSYKLDSDAKWGYMVVRDQNDTIIGPKKEMHWLKVEDMMAVKHKIRNKLSSKSKAAAWFVSNCFTASERETYVEILQEKLEQYHLNVDIYGKCGQFKCSRENMKACLDLLEKNYYFYLAFENAFSEDYVTEKLLHALNHYTIPIVFGGANYSRLVQNFLYDFSPRELDIFNFFHVFS